MCNRLLQHSSEEFDDTDTPILYIRKFDEYGLKILDGGTSSILIDFCPWCGQKLPVSKRDLWFDQIENLGIDHWKDEVPEKFRTDEWYKNNR